MSRFEVFGWRGSYAITDPGGAENTYIVDQDIVTNLDKQVAVTRNGDRLILDASVIVEYLPGDGENPRDRFTALISEWWGGVPGGPPGSGHSTWIDREIAAWRSRRDSFIDDIARVDGSGTTIPHRQKIREAFRHATMDIPRRESNPYVKSWNELFELMDI